MLYLQKVFTQDVKGRKIKMPSFYFNLKIEQLKSRGEKNNTCSQKWVTLDSAYPFACLIEFSRDKSDKPTWIIKIIDLC